MTIAFKCPQCGKVFRVADEMAGKKARCNCGTVIGVPRPAAAQAPTAPSPSASSPDDDPSVDDLLADIKPPAASASQQQGQRPVIATVSAQVSPAERERLSGAIESALAEHISRFSGSFQNVALEVDLTRCESNAAGTRVQLEVSGTVN